MSKENNKRKNNINIYDGLKILVSDSDSDSSNDMSYQKDKLFPVLGKKDYYEAIRNKFLKEVVKPLVPNKLCWITINFDDTKLGAAVQQIPSMINNKLLMRRYFQNKKYYFSVEQRGEQLGVFKGFHIHLLTECLRKSPSALIREFYSSFKDYVGTKQHIDVRKYTSCQVWRDKVLYLKGEKDDPDKALKTKNDHLMRKAYKFKELYTNC